MRVSFALSVPPIGVLHEYPKRRPTEKVPAKAREFTRGTNIHADVAEIASG